MHAHGVEVLDGADGDAVVFAVSHYLHFDFFPAQQRLFDENLVHRGKVEAAHHNLFKLGLVVGNTTTRTTQGECGAYNHRVVADDVFGDIPCLCHVVCNARGGYI